ncbi:dynein regulatory complex subunit 5 [Paramormyrops kingsleyae]|uniref:T-complex-associated-testis-expressed 1 n=1 Tax=Paramormyrops kingsleyae TaxID=1676925 RepID=A0A3B3REI7_9TELE|nr:T-complex-associated testis-expressed protein 1 [Paramormyrops kingsleyae]
MADELQGPGNSAHQLQGTTLPVGMLSPAAGRRTRRIIAEDPSWSLTVVPPLTKLCLQHIVTNFERNPILNELLPSHRAPVLEMLPPQLPLNVTAGLVDDEGYWQRCCVQRWPACDVSAYGHSWKRMYLERHLENAIELFVPDVTDLRSVLGLVPLSKDYVRRLNISQLLPPIKEPEEDDGSDSGSDTSFNGPSLDHFDFGVLLDKLPMLEELHLVYGVHGCGMNFNWNLFEFTYRDCQALGVALKSCLTLKVFRIHQSKVDDEKCRLLVKCLLDHPSLRELDLSHNLIGDGGARAVGKLLNRSKLERLNLCDNAVCGAGGQAIGHALLANGVLTHLNLRLNRLRDEGGRAITQALLSNRTLEFLHLGSNQLTEATATVLSQVFVQNSILETVNLSCNRLGVEGGKALEQGLMCNGTVLACDLRLTEVSLESEGHVKQILQENQVRARMTRIRSPAFPGTPAEVPLSQNQ